jgi:hypothetical protein
MRWIAGHSASSSAGLSEIEWGMWEKEYLTFGEKDRPSQGVYREARRYGCSEPKIARLEPGSIGTLFRERETEEDTSWFCLLL